MKRVEHSNLWSSPEFSAISPGPITEKQSIDGTIDRSVVPNRLATSTLVAMVSNHRAFIELLSRHVSSQNRNGITFTSLGELKDSPIRSMDALLVDSDLCKNSPIEMSDVFSGRGRGLLGLLVDSDHLTDWQIEQAVAFSPTGIFCKTDSLIGTIENMDLWLRGEHVVSICLASRIQVRNNRCTAVNDSEFRLLDERCRDVLRLSALGMPNKSIAAKLNVSLRTVEFHRHSIGKNLGLHNSTEMCRFAIRHGIIQA